MSIASVIFIAAGLMLIYMAALYVLSVRITDAGLVDVGWTTGLGIVALLYAGTLDGATWRKILVGALLAAWAARLAWYILHDRILGREEDGRYQALRAHWGSDANRNFFWFFEAQALLVVLFSLPVLVVMLNPAPEPGAWELIGCAIWVLAVGGETLADRQLARFRSDPSNKGKVCRDGLWRYSRHPNYFFEWLHWWAYVAMAVGLDAWWVTLLGPVLMLVFLMKVTGIPYTEKKALASRGQAYRDYQDTTSMFIPWVPKRKNS